MCTLRSFVARIFVVVEVQDAPILRLKNFLIVSKLFVANELQMICGFSGAGSSGKNAVLRLEAS